MSRVSKNIAYNLVGQTLVVVLGFWGTRLVFHQLGDEALGILYFAIAMNAVLTPVIDLGISSTVVREVARYQKADPQYVVRLARTCGLFYWCSYAFLAAAVWLIAPWLVSHWITLRTLNAGVAAQALRLLALSLLLMLPRSLYSNLLRGVERMEFNNLIDTATAALRQGGTILIVIAGGGLVAIGYCYLVVLLLGILGYVIAASRFFHWGAFLPGFSRDVVRQNSSFASQVGAYSVLSVVHMEADKTLLSKLAPVGLLGFYGVSQSMVARISMLPGAVNQAAFPRLSALFHNCDRAGLVREYRRLQDLICYGLVPVFALVIFSSRPLFTYLLSAQASHILMLPTILLCLGFYMNGTLNMPAVVSLAVDRPDIGAKQNFYALFITLPVTAALIWEWGLIGAGLSLVFYHLYAYTYGARRVATECLGMRARDWYFHVIKVLALAALTYGTAGVILVVSNQNSVASLAVAYAVSSVAYGYAAYMALGEELREGLVGWRVRISNGTLRYIGSNS